MECSICMELITPTTGVYVTSCNHTFHLRCTVTWLLNSPKETCPMCRKKLTHHERLPVILTEDDNLSDSQDSDDTEAEEFKEWVSRTKVLLIEDDASTIISMGEEAKEQFLNKYRNTYKNIKELPCPITKIQHTCHKNCDHLHKYKDLYTDDIIDIEDWLLPDNNNKIVTLS